MKAYYFVFVLTLIISLLYQAKTDKQWRWKLFWTFMPLFIYAAIRVDYGNDYDAYESFFYQIHESTSFSLDSEVHAEIGYQLLNRFMPSFRSILILSSFLLCLALGIFCYRYIPRDYLWLSIILIFLNPEKNIMGTLVGIRHGMVVSCFLIGFIFIQNRKWIPFFILTIGLSFIHRSALLYLPLAYFVGMNTSFSKKELVFWGIGTAALLLMSMTTLFSYVSLLIDNEYLDRYNYYLEDTSMHRGTLSILSNLLFLSGFILYMLQRCQEKDDPKLSILRLGMLFSVMAFLGSLSMRSSYFYDLFLIGGVITIVADKKANILLRIGLVLLTVVVSYYSFFHVWMGSEWWNHEIYHSLLGDW